jgi:sarcosine oxidase/L-pipecolate oxidase
LGHIFNALIEHGTYPYRMKFASLKPMHKTGEKVVMANYRPISLLISFSKIFERVMYSRIKQHMYTNNLISLAQFGFRENSNTEMAIYILTSPFLERLERHSHAVGIFCDLAKVYDCVSRDILLSKLAIYSISDKIIIWLKSYLDNRKQMVELFNNGNGKCCSHWVTVKYGVTQGSILGSLSFLIYINDLPLVQSTNNKRLLYEDDISILVSGTNINEI